MNRQIIKVNGTDTPVISSSVSIKAYPPMPQHEPTPPELKKPGMNAKKWNVAFRKWAQEAEARFDASLIEWRKNRNDIVSLTIMFPDCVFTWANPRSLIPGRKKDFAIQDIIEIDSRLCVHLRDGRNLGMGYLDDQAHDVMLAYELMLSRESKKSNEPEAFCTFKDAALWCKRSEKTLRNWRDNGLLKVEKYGVRKISIMRRDLEECLSRK